MTESSRLSERVLALEEQIRHLPANPPRARRTGLITSVLLAAPVVVTLWLAWSYQTQLRALSHERLFWRLCHDGTTSAERAQAFLYLLAADNTVWESARLNDLNLEGADVPGADIQAARFISCRLQRANFAGAQLSRSSFNLSDLSDAEFSNATLAETSFLKATLERAAFRNADLRGATLEQSKARRGNFVLADLSEANLLLADLSEANLTGANLTDANLEAANFRGANLALTRLPGTRLTDADFSDSNWWRARGFSRETLDDFKVRFPPSGAAEESLRNDFVLWLSADTPTE